MTEIWADNKRDPELFTTQSTTSPVFTSATGTPSLKYTGSPNPPTLSVDSFSADIA